MINVAIVGSNGLVNRLPEVLSHPEIRIHVLAEAGSPLLMSAFVAGATRLALPQNAAQPERIMALAEGLLERDFELVIYADDLQALLLAQSELPLADKLRILPVRRESGIPLISSKAGLALTMAAAGVPGPVSLVAPDAVTLAEIVATGARPLEAPLVLKADIGGGGKTVRVFADAQALGAFECPPDWFPVVVQEFIEGDLIGVDALFWNGELRGWLYAENVEDEGNFGVATARKYRFPSGFDCEESLQKLGAAAGLHGFFNCSFIWNAEQSRHFLFEADARPTAWHQFGPRLGVDWSSLLLQGGVETGLSTPRYPSLRGAEEVVIRLYPRELRSGLRKASGAMLLPWIRRHETTWAMRNTADRAINRSETMELLFWSDVYVKRIFGGAFVARAKRAIRFMFAFR